MRCFYLHGTCRRSYLVAGVSRVELGEDRRRYAFQHLLGEDAQQLPPDVQRLEDGPVLVVALGYEVLLELGEELQVQEIVRRQRLLADDGLHGLHVLPDGVTSVLKRSRFA